MTIRDLVRQKEKDTCLLRAKKITLFHHLSCLIVVYIAAIMFLISSYSFAQDAPSHDEAMQTLRKATSFFHSKAASHGGYVWRYSENLRFRRGEGKATESMIWVQPPGTPTVGQAFLNAYEVTGEQLYLDAALDAAYALVKGQLHSGGWYYYIEFDRQKRRKYAYRESSQKRHYRDLTAWNNEHYVGGWAVWKKHKYEGNVTILDDDTTQAALRFMMRIDQNLEFKNEKIHASVHYALASLLKAQYPNGAWSHNYDRFPKKSLSPDYYPVIQASYPQSWSRTWTKDFSGCYMLNDRITPNIIATMLDAYEIYDEERYLESAEQGGKFLLLAQMPEPQPAWAQQYDRHMRPVWDRGFEPPAITGMESQDVLETLLLLYRKTAESKYLEPIPKTIDYLRKSLLPDSRLARFYELKTNRPLYFTKDYQLTYGNEDVPTHYSFIVESRLDPIEAEYRRLRHASQQALQHASQQALQSEDAAETELITSELARKVSKIIDSMNEQGAWVEKGWISSETFVENVRALCRFIAADK